MFNLLISLALGAVVFIAVALPVGPVAAALPGVASATLAYYLLARYTSKKLDAAMPEVQKHLMARRFDPAIARLLELKNLGKWQFLVGPSLDAQIGMIYYAYKQEFEKAIPYLERAYAKQWQAKAMLAAWHYKKKNFEAMEKTFDDAIRDNKKSGILYSAFAWCQWKRGKRQEAMDLLTRAQKVKDLEDDERIKNNLLALQNNRKMKMKPYAEDWWLLMLEKPPVQMAASPMGGRGGKGRRAMRRR